MNYILTKSKLAFIFEVLQQTPSFPDPLKMSKLFQKIAAHGWAFKSDLEDLLDCMDQRLNQPEFQLIEFSKLLGIHWENACYRPRLISRGVIQQKALRAQNVALFLIYLERLGFLTSPDELIKILLPEIKSKKRKIISDSELEIFWYQQTKHKTDPICLKVEDCPDWSIEGKPVITSTKYILIPHHNDLNDLVMIEIRAPRYRERRLIQDKTCSICGLQWQEGDPESSLLHKRQHEKRLLYLQPEPLPEMIKEIQRSLDYELVTKHSPLWKHREMYLRAKGFKREMQFDFFQWPKPSSDSTLKTTATGILFTETSGRIVGACSFIPIQEGSVLLYWLLDWAWIAPTERRKGHLTARWSMFKKKFGKFMISSPVSEEMQSFLIKQGDLFMINQPSIDNS